MTWHFSFGLCECTGQSGMPLGLFDMSCLRHGAMREAAMAIALSLGQWPRRTSNEWRQSA
jgi:hypothetical protein